MTIPQSVTSLAARLQPREAGIRAGRLWRVHLSPAERVRITSICQSRMPDAACKALALVAELRVRDAASGAEAVLIAPTTFGKGDLPAIAAGLLGGLCGWAPDEPGADDLAHLAELTSDNPVLDHLLRGGTIPSREDYIAVNRWGDPPEELAETDEAETFELLDRLSGAA